MIVIQSYRIIILFHCTYKALRTTGQRQGIFSPVSVGYPVQRCNNLRSTIAYFSQLKRRTGCMKFKTVWIKTPSSTSFCVFNGVLKVCNCRTLYKRSWLSIIFQGDRFPSLSRLHSKSHLNVLETIFLKSISVYFLLFRSYSFFFFCSYFRIIDYCCCFPLSLF